MKKPITTAILSLLIYSAFGLVGSVQAETDHSSSGSAEQAGSKKRPLGSEFISDNEIQFLEQNFFRSDESLRERYENATAKKDLFLPAGITSVLTEPPNESVIAQVLAELSGSLNKTQLDSLKKKAQEITSDIREKNPKDRDIRLLALTQRSEWLTYIIGGQTPGTDSLPTPKDEKAFENFKAKFLAAQKEVNEKNKEILAKISEAKNGNKDAKTWLRERLDMKSMTQFMQGQKASGGEQLFEDTAEAIVWKDSSGNKYHDFGDADGRVKRVYVDNSPKDHAKQFGEFLNNSAGLKGWSISRTNLTAGTPEIINLTKKTLPSNPTSSSQSSKPTGGNSQAIPSGSLTTKATRIFANNCVACHKRDGNPITDFALAARLVQSGSMPRGKRLSEEEKGALIQFLAGSEPKDHLLEIQQ